MYDFSYADPKDMYYKILADRVRYFKEDEGFYRPYLRKNQSSGCIENCITKSNSLQHMTYLVYGSML